MKNSVINGSRYYPELNWFRAIQMRKKERFFFCTQKAEPIFMRLSSFSSYEEYFHKHGDVQITLGLIDTDMIDICSNMDYTINHQFRPQLIKTISFKEKSADKDHILTSAKK